MTLMRDSFNSSERVPVSVIASPLVDLVVAMWSMIAEAESHDSFESHADIVALSESTDLSNDDVAWMAESGGQRWSFLLEFIVDGNLQTIDELADTVADTDPGDLFHSLNHDVDHCEDDTCGKHLEITDPAADRQRLVGVLRSIASDAASTLKEGAASLEHDRMLTEFLARRLEAEQLIETVTNGISYRLDPTVEEVVLLPSLMIRPWNLLFSFDTSRYFVYSVSDEAVQADGDTPPMWMIEMFKSLGDERRLRLLRKLGDGPAGWQSSPSFWTWPNQPRITICACYEQPASSRPSYPAQAKTLPITNCGPTPWLTPLAL